MLSFQPGDLPVKKFYGLIASAVGPRPIALVSTISKDGIPNLTPFSFFNFFGANPPILVFSPMRRISNAETKHSLHNVEQVKEAVINVVNYTIVHQSSLASTDYPEEVNEFEKTGLTMLDSTLIKPKRVAESPVQFECKVNDIVYTGKGGGAANLVICEVLKMHIAEAVTYAGNKIDQYKLDQVARMGGSWYTRANVGMFELPKPVNHIGMGVDQLPEPIRKSTVLTGNNLAQLANVSQFPSDVQATRFVQENEWEEFIATSSVEKIHAVAREFLVKNEVENAWNILWAATLKKI